MRALTLTQPWAGLVASGIKLVENRPRPIVKREDFGKSFAIHASREIDEDVYAQLRENAPDVCPAAFSTFDPDAIIPASMLWYRLSRITSAVIAVATIDRVLDPAAHGVDPDSDDARAPLAADQRRWFFGPIGYVLRDVIALPTPVPCRGWQGFWTLNGDTTAKVNAQL